MKLICVKIWWKEFDINFQVKWCLGMPSWQFSGFCLSASSLLHFLSFGFQSMPSLFWSSYVSASGEQRGIGTSVQEDWNQHSHQVCLSFSKQHNFFFFFKDHKKIPHSSHFSWWSLSSGKDLPKLLVCSQPSSTHTLGLQGSLPQLSTIGSPQFRHCHSEPNGF